MPGIHVDVQPSVSLLDTGAAYTNLATYMRDKVSGKPADQCIDLFCVGESAAVAMKGTLELMHAQPIYGSAPDCPCPTDPLEQAKALEDAAKVLEAGAKSKGGPKGAAVGAFSWSMLWNLIKLVIEQLLPLLPQKP